MSVTIESARRRPALDETRSDPAFETIFRDHWARVYGVLYRLVGDRLEAEDLALEAFWRLYSRQPSRNGKQGPAGWLYRVATNLGLNALRARNRRRRYEEQAGMLALESTAAADPAFEAERAEERHQVRRALARMKSRSARLLILRHSGLSYAELASTFGLAPASIGALLARAEREFERLYENGHGRGENASDRG